MREIWKDIPGYNGAYQASNLGRIKSKKHKQDKIMRLHFRTLDKRVFVSLCKNGKRKECKVHRLICETFIPNPENKPCINHIDFNPSNNRLENLEWCTYSENMIHSSNHNRLFRTDTAKKKISKLNRGNGNGMAKITEDQAIFIKRTCINDPKLKNIIAREFKITRATINDILAKRSWKHLI